MAPLDRHRRRRLIDKACSRLEYVRVLALARVRVERYMHGNIISSI
ncbi:hypothetical protein KCP76_02935 [Salmonella enterica subsp. enterica serovar Weltevreden]|nr:hypothetical protein KCP76_02935 [Salmonella enterica subsp. enterica serovar Weltevreden]